MYPEASTWTMTVRHKHLKLDQGKIDFAKRYFGVDSEQEAIERALALLMDEERIARRLRPLTQVVVASARCRRHAPRPSFATSPTATAGSSLRSWAIASCRSFSSGRWRAATHRPTRTSTC